MEVNQDLWTEEQPIMFNSLNLDKGIQQHSSSPGNHEKSRFSYHLPEIKCYHEYMHNIVNSILVLYINHRFTNCVIPPYIDWVQGDKKSGTDRWFPTIKRSVGLICENMLKLI